jgi:hypothetical protein
MPHGFHVSHALNSPASHADDTRGVSPNQNCQVSWPLSARNVFELSIDARRGFARSHSCRREVSAQIG